MPRRLIVMRHAKSDWGTSATTDHERPLNRRGCRDAPNIAAELVSQNWQPDCVLSSDAQRTRETFQRMEDEFTNSPTVEFLGSLYHAGIREIVAAVSMVPDELTTVMVLGHNPGWQSSVFVLSGESVMMTTANAALLTLECDSWAESIVQEGAWKLLDVLRPKELN